MQTLTEMRLWTGGDIVGPAITRDRGDGARVLDPHELHLVEVHADPGVFSTRRPLLIAFAQAGADAEETARVTPDDIDLAAGIVRLSGRAARVNPLTLWGLDTVRSILSVDAAAPGVPLCVSPGLPMERAAHSVTVRLREVLVDAGLAGRPRVTARSIRLTIAARVLEVDGIEAAARFLGNESLDATANALDHSWWRH